MDENSSRLDRPAAPALDQCYAAVGVGGTQWLSVSFLPARRGRRRRYRFGGRLKLAARLRVVRAWFWLSHPGSYRSFHPHLRYCGSLCPPGNFGGLSHPSAPQRPCVGDDPSVRTQELGLNPGSDPGFLTRRVSGIARRSESPSIPRAGTNWFNGKQLTCEAQVILGVPLDARLVWRDKPVYGTQDSSALINQKVLDLGGVRRKVCR